MLKPKPLWLVSGAAIAALAFSLLGQNKTAKTDIATTKAGSEFAPKTAPAAPESADKAGINVQSDAEREALFLADVTTRFAPHITIKHAQIRFLEQVISYLKAHYPDDWQSRVYAILQASFPELSDELMGKFESLQSYNSWLVADREMLQKMSASERRKLLWDKRYAAFGMEAEEIWAAEIRNQKIQDALESVEQNPDGDLLSRAESVVTAIEKTYGDNSQHFIRSRQTELLNKFLDLPSIQSELRDLPATQRRASLREVRATLGMDNEALDRWEALDQQRDDSWENGSAYMQERQRLLGNDNDAPQTRELYALQERYFGRDAEQIRREEASGFFRYDRERRIGRE